jgi:uncharacterized MAPEG superfamily protein
MTIASYLVLSVTLYILMIGIQDVYSTRQYGLGPLIGARDSLPKANVMVGRAKRMNQNMVEALAMFTPLALLAIHSDTVDATFGAAIFFWSRVIYVPMYLFGVPLGRTLVWLVSIGGLILMMIRLWPLG